MEEKSKVVDVVIVYIRAVLLMLLAAAPLAAFADVEIKDGVFGFYGQEGEYNVMGVVKNSGSHDVFGTVIIQLEYKNKITTVTADTYSIRPDSEMPFKIPIYDVDGEIPKILDASVKYIAGISVPQVDVIYDKTLIVHPDGHVTGRIVNSGDVPVKHVKLVAVAHGVDHARLDVVANENPITYMMPGEVRDFAMYPDAAVSEDVTYYSCFGLGDLSIISLNTQRSGEVFPVRYDSGLLLAYPEFNDENTDLSITIAGGWPLHDSINVEFPKYDSDEKFDLHIDGKPVEFIQSLDEFDRWHVAFNVEPQTTGTLVISGFDPDAVYGAIPQKVRMDVKMWAIGEIDDVEFSGSMAYLVGRDAILQAPDWVRNSAGWWAIGLISDDEFVTGLKYLATLGIIS